MPRLPNKNAARRNARREHEGEEFDGRAPNLRDASKHHPSTRKWWKAIANSPQASMLDESGWEWLQAKAWRLDAYFSDPVGATTALAREVDEVMGKMVILPRDIIASGYKPPTKPKTTEAKSAATVTSLGDRRAQLIEEDAAESDAS